MRVVRESSKTIGAFKNVVEATPLFVLLGVVGEFILAFSLRFRRVALLPPSVPHVSAASAAAQDQSGKQRALWHFTNKYVCTVSFGVWRGSQTLFYEPSVKADRSKRSTMFSVDDKQAADWQKSKEARGDWWHMMDKARGAGGDRIFGESSPQQTWAGKDRGTQVTPDDADYVAQN